MEQRPSDVPTAALDSGGSDTPAERRPGVLEVGTTLGRYVLLEQIGEGGMGRVLRAYDPKLEREVAIKEVHRSALSADATARLVAEARAMARLSHPNVVPVFDVEELDEDELALVMEYVPGTTLRDWLRAAKHDWRAVLTRFVDAGQGLAAAHAAGLLHRDFKPSNVLLSNTGRVLVSDFGLAKGVNPSEAEALEDPDSPKSSDDLTRTGALMGTPRYMAPEQYDPHWNQRAAHNDLAAAADQYAFCVAVWEGLHGKPPFDRVLYPGQKIAGAPPWPDSPIPRSVADAIRRGLSPLAEDRWADMQELLRALAPYTQRRRRRWGGLALAGAVGVGASIGAVVWDRAERPCTNAADQLSGIWDASRRADVEAALTSANAAYAATVVERTRNDLDAFAEDWVAMHDETCEATAIRGVQSEAVMDLRMACLHRSKVQLEATVDVLASSDAEVLARAHDVVGALRPVSRCADVERLQSGVDPPDPEDADAVEQARALLATANAQREAGRFQVARTKLADARHTLEGVDYPPIRAEIDLEEGIVLSSLGQYESAAQALQRALKQGGRSQQRDVMGVAASSLLYVVGSDQGRTAEAMRYVPIARSLCRTPRARGTFHNNLGTVLDRSGRYAEAEAEHRKAIAIWLDEHGPDNWITAQSRDNLAIVLAQQGKYDEAETEHREALRIRIATLGRDHPSVGDSVLNLATMLLRRGKPKEAEQEYRRALSMWRSSLGADHPHLAEVYNNLASALDKQGRGEEAETMHRRGLAIRLAALGPDHPDVAMSRVNLGVSLYARNKFAEAEVEYRAALELWERTIGPEHPDVALPLNNIGAVLNAQGKFVEAEAAFRRALKISEAVLGPEHRQSCTIRDGIASSLENQQRYAEAEAQWRRLLQLRESALGPDHPSTVAVRYDLANLLVIQGKFDQALPFAEAAWAGQQGDDVSVEDRARVAYALARALWSASTPDRDRARPLFERAAREFRTIGDHATATDIEAFLAKPR